ncbi:MAG: tetratricopeptide repeat protein [Treponema sp.]|jgi:putative GTP pyrophosphokinase|nr:tetratricopeptide repeat protein [Treponema sp.]
MSLDFSGSFFLRILVMEEKTPLPNQSELRKEYDAYLPVREMVTRDLELQVEDVLAALNSRPSVKGRVKDFSSWYKKYIRILKNGDEESPIITDLLGLRIVCPFLEDLGAAEALLKKRFDITEIERKGAGYSFKEFGYESTHLLIEIPREIITRRGDPGAKDAEVQIRTILQDAWAEVEHELVYKAEFTPFDDPMKRKLAAINASLSLADTIFQEIRNYQRQLNGELGKRREAFFRKIEEATDGMLFQGKEAEDADFSRPGDDPSLVENTSTIDDLLLNALYAHNRNKFGEAIAFYSRILELDSDERIASLIYKHRGMAYFAQSRYQEAIDDFSASIKLDGSSYKAAYYRGVVRSVLQQYADAVGDYSLALEINPYQAFCLYRRGQAYYHLGDLPQALGDCEAALSLESGNTSFQKFRELLHSKLKM